jgi:transcriptional regulator of aroF, aroG, tyrA and aromatic amino acid transport
LTSRKNLKLHLRFQDRLGIVADVAVALAAKGANIIAMEVERHHIWADIFLEVESDDHDLDGTAIIAVMKPLATLHQARLIKTLPREKRENRFHVVLDNVSDGILSIDRNGNITTINRVAQEFLDCKDHHVLGKPIAVLDMSDNQLLDCLDAKTYTNQKRHLITSQGRVRYLATGKPIVDSTGRVAGAVEIMKDMKEVTALAKVVNQPAEITFSDFYGRSPSIQAAVAFAQKIAKTDSIVSVRGQSGTGKELFSRAIHAESGRMGPFVPVNCAALPEALLESELFGYVGGAFTDARREGKPGLFELAMDGTIFLDEIGEMPPGPQAKILRIIQEKRVRRIGGSREIPVNARIITATNQDLEAMVAANRFRQDLYYRINVLPIQIPPLNQRPEDVEALAVHFLNKVNHSLRKPAQTLDPDARQKLKDHPWPGNVRELKNVISRAAILSESNRIDASHIVLSDELATQTQYMPGAPAQALQPLSASVAKVEKSCITAALAAAPSIRSAAKTLGMSHTTLLNKIKKHNIRKEKTVSS